jgi:hypothetical protein
MPDNEDARLEAEAKLEEARVALDVAAQAASDAQAGLVAVVSRDVPRVIVEVLANNVMCHEGESYGEGDEFAIGGADAISLMQQGHVIIKGAE